jgi:hypothetical protein
MAYFPGVYASGRLSPPCLKLSNSLPVRFGQDNEQADESVETPPKNDEAISKPAIQGRLSKDGDLLNWAVNRWYRLFQPTPQYTPPYQRRVRNPPTPSGYLFSHPEFGTWFIENNPPKLFKNNSKVVQYYDANGAWRSSLVPKNHVLYRDNFRAIHWKPPDKVPPGATIVPDISKSPPYYTSRRRRRNPWI